MGDGKLTKAQRKALEWFRDNGPAHLFPLNGPSAVTRRSLVAKGLVEKAGNVIDHFPLPFMSYRITDAGRRALTPTEGEEL